MIKQTEQKVQSILASVYLVCCIYCGKGYLSFTKDRKCLECGQKPVRVSFLDNIRIKYDGQKLSAEKED